MLLRRQSLPVPEAIEHLVGIQAQNPNDPYVALWSRLEAFKADQLANLMREREVVRCGLMRGTIHLVTARDCFGLRPAMQPVYDRVYRNGKSFGAKLGDDVDRVTEAAVELMRERALTKGELKAALAQRWPQHDPEALSFVMSLISAVQVTPRGVWGRSGRARWALSEEWLEGCRVPGLAIDDVVLRYLAAFGPASVPT